MDQQKKEVQSEFKSTKKDIKGVRTEKSKNKNYCYS